VQNSEDPTSANQLPHHTISPAFNWNRQPTLRSRNLLTLRLTSRWDTQTGCPTAQWITQTLACQPLSAADLRMRPAKRQAILWPPCSLTDTWSMCDGRPRMAWGNEHRPKVHGSVREQEKTWRVLFARRRLPPRVTARRPHQFSRPTCRRDDCWAAYSAGCGSENEPWCQLLKTPLPWTEKILRPGRKKKQKGPVAKAPLLGF
jgi:hypothetical protein